MEIEVPGGTLRLGRDMIELDTDMADVAYRARGEWTNLTARFERVDFSRSVFDPFNAMGATFVDCRFSGARFKSGGVGITMGGRQTVFRRCGFERADLRGVRPYDVRFEACSFDRARIDGWWADAAEFVDCAFTGPIRKVRFAGRCTRDLLGVTRARNEFRGNDFTAAELDWVEFTWGIDLAAQRLPSGPDYVRLDRRAERVARARAEVARWANEQDREYALFWLRLLSEHGQAEQTEVFKRRENITRRNPKAGTRLLELLEAPL